MGKARIAYVCGECGAEYSKWQGQCGECSAWNTLSQIVLEPAGSSAGATPAASRRASWAGKVDPPKVTALKDVGQAAEVRVSTGIGELDRVLGGGLVEGAVVLVGGDPGIGEVLFLDRRPRMGRRAWPGVDGAVAGAAPHLRAAAGDWPGRPGPWRSGRAGLLRRARARGQRAEDQRA